LLAVVAPLPPTRAVAEDTELRANLVFRVDPALPGCWDEAEFRRRIGHRVGFDPFQDDAPVSVLVNVTGSTTAVGGRVEWKDAKTGGMGERRFVAKDGNCGRLLAEMSFAVALQIEMLRPAPKPEPIRTAPAIPLGDTGTQTKATATATSDKSTTQPNVPTVPDEPVPPAPSRPEPADKSEDSSRQDSSETDAPAARWAISAGFGSAALWGLSPSATADFRLFIAVRRNDLSIEISGDASYPSDELRWHGFGFRSRWMGGMAAFCGHLSAFSTCALGRVGKLRIEGLGVDRPESPSSVVAQTGLRLGGTAELSKGWFVTARLEGFLSLTPHTVQMNDVELWRMPHTSGLLGLDVGLRFW
jgi:hypothetical protein